MSAKKKKAYERLIAEGWGGVASFALLPDERIVAGENGACNVCCWSADRSVAWKRSLGRNGGKSRYEHHVNVVFAGDVVLAHMAGHGTVFALDRSTGEIVGKHAVPKETRTFAITPDRRTLVLRTGTETTICAYPSFQIAAKLEEYCNMNNIALSADGKWLVVNGHEVHVYDLAARKLVTTFEPPESPWALAFTSAGHLISGDDTCMIRVYDARKNFQLVKEVKPPSSRKPTITALATSDKHLAVGTEDGKVTLRELGDFEIVSELKGHDASIPDTGATELAQIAFDRGGARLIVAAGMKKEPPGLTLHTIDR